jgi:hypothetical protein
MRTKERPDVAHECFLFVDMLQYVVNEYKVVPVGRAGVHIEDVAGLKAGCVSGLGKQFARLQNPAFRQVNACYLAASLGKGQQVATVSTSYFQYAGGMVYLDKVLYVRQEVVAAAKG